MLSGMGLFSRIFGGSSNEGSEKAERGDSGEAAQLARLLVSELALYNEEALESARRRGNVYAALKGEIDRIRKAYDERVDRQKVERDYLYLEMVSRLARGQAEILGVPPSDSADPSTGI